MLLIIFATKWHNSKYLSVKGTKRQNNSFDYKNFSWKINFIKYNPPKQFFPLLNWKSDLVLTSSDSRELRHSHPGMWEKVSLPNQTKCRNRLSNVGKNGPLLVWTSVFQFITHFLLCKVFSLKETWSYIPVLVPGQVLLLPIL